MRDVVSALFDAGFTRADIVRLTAGNLRRFFASSVTHKGHDHD
jgi:hypothetical protein